MGLKSEDVIQGVRKQKSQVVSGTCSGAVLLDSSQIVATALFLLGKRRTGKGHNGSSSLGTVKCFLAVKKIHGVDLCVVESCGTRKQCCFCQT